MSRLPMIRPATAQTAPTSFFSAKSTSIFSGVVEANGSIPMARISAIFFRRTARSSFIGGSIFIPPIYQKEKEKTNQTKPLRLDKNQLVNRANFVRLQPGRRLHFNCIANAFPDKCLTQRRFVRNSAIYWVCFLSADDGVGSLDTANSNRNDRA